MRAENVTELLRYDFTKDEIADKSMALAQSLQLLRSTEEEKKHAVSQYAERIAEQVAKQSQLSRQITSGWETRPIECAVQYNSPNIGMKIIIRKDTGEIIRTRSMSTDELQENLFTQEAVDSVANVVAFFNADPTTGDVKPA